MLEKRKLALNVKGTVCYVLTLIVIGWLWWFLRSYFFAVLFFVIAVSAGASVAVLWISREGFCAAAHLPENRVGKGSRFSFSLRLDNPRRLIGFPTRIGYEYSNIFTQARERQTLYAWAAPGQSTVLEGSAVSRYAGRVEIRITQFYVYDLFRIMKLTGCGKRDAWVIAYPQKTPADEEELASCVEDYPEENEVQKKGIDFNPDYEIREYIPGDELKNIHWKLTAKQKRLMVRERLASGREKMNLVLPLGEDEKTNDALMDSLQSLAELLIREEYPVQLFWHGKEEELRTCYLAEQGELENVLGEILSCSGLFPEFPEELRERMAFEYPGESYILIRTGAYQGAYIR